MSDFKFMCPQCDQHLEAPEELLGQIIECPTCNTSFQLPSQRSHDAKVAHRSLTWVGAGESIKVGPYEISDAFTYTSIGPPLQEEASCIDLRLSLGIPIVEPRGTLGYRPQYSRLSPNQRTNYLTWLAGGRQTELGDVGYYFIYFYGLERRALLDNDDIETVLTQTNRLICRYSAERGLFGYGSRFIAYILAKVGLDNLPRESFDIIFAQAIKEFDDDTLAVALAWLFTANAPLPSYLAFEVVQKDIRASRSAVIARVGGAFRTLFCKKYEDRCGAGMQLAAAPCARHVCYRPASPTLSAPPPVPMPDVLGHATQFSPLIQLWEECIKELRPLSREIGSGENVVPRLVYQALPDALKAKVDHPDREKWEQFVAANTGARNIVVTTVSKLAALCEYEQRPRLTARQGEEMATTAGAVGFVLVPDSRVTGRTYKWNDMVALFRPEGRPDVVSDKKYRAAALMLEMGMAVAASDGVVEQEEVDEISNFLTGQFLLTPDDARRIDAHKEILIKQPPVLTALTKRLKSALTADHLQQVCRFLVGIAAANGSIEKQERLSLRRFYTALGLPVSSLDEIIAKLLGPVPESVEVSRGTTIPGEMIPSRHSQPVFTLNADALQSILQETEQVAKMLGDALMASSDEEAQVIVAGVQRLHAESAQAITPGVSEHNESLPTFTGLDPRYSVVVAELLSREAWTPEDFDALARKHKVMPAGMLETINTWSDENHGDFLIEEGEHYTIKQNLLEKT